MTVPENRETQEFEMSKYRSQSQVIIKSYRYEYEREG